MPRDGAAHPWLQRVDRTQRPIYQAILEALTQAIRTGDLQPGEQLPPQRAVADALGVDFTTVTRAYTEARAKGLIEGAVGRGTFVRAGGADEEPGVVDLSMNVPPPPDGLSLGAMMRDGLQAILQRADAATLMAYHPGAGTLSQKAAGAAWLRPTLGEVDPRRILVCPGAQTALAAALSALTRPGDAIVVEPLTYPGLKSLAAQLGLRLLACPADEQGVRPDELARLCREARPAALYLVPTMQNPTAATLPAGRRRDIAKVVLAEGLWLVEDDPYARLAEAPGVALAALAPGRTIHVATLSKCLSPGLRTAYLVCPDEAATARIGEALRALALMAAPLMTALATSWIRDGVAETLLAGVRREVAARRDLAARILPQARGDAQSIHVWLDLPDPWRPEALRRAAQDQGLSLVPAEAFAAGGPHPEGVRISLGGVAKRTVLEAALGNVRDLVYGPAAAPKLVV